MKKISQRYIFPAVFGLLIYTSIRLVNDSMEETQFWNRSWQQNTIEIIASILLGIIFSYMLRYIIHTSKLDTRKIERRKILIEFLKVFIASLIVFNPVLYLIHFLIDDPVSWSDFIIGNLLVILFVLLQYAFIRGYYLIQLYIQQNSEMEKLKMEQLETELKFLKAQYHPHFLFNALNTVYFQMDENVTDAKRTVENFSELLRYQVYHHHQPALLETELKYLQSFIQLQKVRSSDKLKLNMSIDKNLNGEKIYPMLLLPLVENAFKYVGGDYKINISMNKEDNWLVFRVMNSVPHIMTATNGGIGLENLQRRLALLYPNKHNLSAGKTNTEFTAVLKILPE